MVFHGQRLIMILQYDASYFNTGGTEAESDLTAKGNIAVTVVQAAFTLYASVIILLLGTLTDCSSALPFHRHSQ